MFSPEAPISGSRAARNPRRRHRTTSEDSLAVTSKRRKRSSLAPDTFEPPPAGSGAAGSGSKAHEQQQLGKLSNGGGATSREPSPEEVRSKRDASVEATTSLALRSRGSKRGDNHRRGSKREDGALQAKTDHYIVRKDDTLPPALKNVLGKEAWHAEFSQSLGWAVALTHTQAIVWPYSVRKAATEHPVPLSIKLPWPNVPTKSSKEPLPLGALVHDSGAGELALLVVMPSSGKIVYWESLASAAKMDGVRQKQPGIQGTLSGMFSGEIITKLTDAEPDGFVLTSSVGRVIHLSVRDPQGRPSIHYNFLRSDTNTKTSLLGSFKSVFSSAGWRKDIAAVRPTTMRGKNNRQCLVVNVQAQFQIWNLIRHGNKLLEYEMDAKPAIQDAIFALHPERDSNRLEFHVMDFTFFPESRVRNKVAQQNDRHKLLVLCGFIDGHSTFNYLVDLSLQEGAVDVHVVHPITCWSRQPAVDSKWPALKPRVLLPEPGHTAFVASDTWFIMISLAQVEESPDSQLQLEAHTLSEPFQDILFLNRDTDDRLVGCVIEQPDKDSANATCFLIANTFGLARVTALPAGEGETKVERRAAACRSRIEQGVFFGNSTKNFLDFRVNLNQVDWEDSEIDEATRQVNDSILENQSKYIPQMSPSMEHQIKLRAGALHDLIKYVGNYKLSVATRWHLLWSAEKIAAAKAIWQTYSKELAENEKGDKLLLPELLDILHQRFKHENNPELGETDIVRHYLINDVARIEKIIPYAQQSVEELYSEGIRKPRQQASLISQANDLQASALESAFEFREANAELYGIGRDMFEEGVYRGDYSPLPEFWTSLAWGVARVKKETDLSREVALNNAHSPMEGEEGIEEELLTKLALDTSRLVSLTCRVYEERCRWLKSRADEKSQAAGKALQDVYLKVRKELIVKLTDLELFDDAFVFAERYADIEALADVYARVEEICAEAMGKPGIEEDEALACSLRLEDNQRRLEKYFTSYGVKWANAIYSRRLRTGELTELLNENEKHSKYLTSFLRERPNLVKLGWMNEVALKNYKLASENLEAANKKERLVWNKQIELSLAKLSLLAARERGQIDDDTARKQVKKSDRRLSIIRIQESLYAYTRPLLVTAIDRAAEIDLAMDSFGGYVKDKPCLQDILRRGFDRLVRRHALDAEELIDVLTTMTPSDLIVDDEDFAGQRFFLALRLLKLMGFEGERRDLHRAMIWRRCMLQDDWVAFNRTEHKDDEAVAEEMAKTVLFQTLKEGFQSGLLTAPSPGPLSPSSILLPESNNPPSVSSLRASARYTHSPDSFLQSLATDLSAEDLLLKQAVEKGRLEKWFPGFVEGAELAVRKEADRRGEAEMAAMQAIMDEERMVFLAEGGTDEEFEAQLRRELEEEAKENAGKNGDVDVDVEMGMA